ncbi:MAG: ferrous iron transport protein A [Proteobacteria bacterium]|nr:ferrous iron transport protein A [Pseudomonadota bacterium]
MLTLDAVPVGQQVRMKGFYQHTQAYRHKLLAMGLTPGVLMTIVCIAPLGDPIQVKLRGYTLSLRKRECQQIEVEVVNESSCAGRQS